ncbi:TBC1 domain-containing protein [Echinococcus granulosus]|uniref:TBC1 domain-containing protein n=1 Tax=Echinococcus granulosus TaxID=6210 RepID=W6UBK2_ECHGR|nr:TBC1 domain-containing protein [Echinococcus granulosus]EUB58470.1 TBC1 domain-containing protein [Echinococcus granulosus]
MRESRSKVFQDILEFPLIDLNQLRKACFLGCPESYTIRSVVWKLLLNYLPLQKSLWDCTLSKARTEYEGFLMEFVANKSRLDKSADHPLSSDPCSNWREYFDDNRILLQINKDCRRLYPELDFFRRPTQYPCNEAFSVNVSVSDLRNRIETELTRSHDVAANTIGALKLVTSCDSIRGSNSLLRAACDESFVKDGSTDDAQSNELSGRLEMHWEVVQRIIFIFYKINKGSSYVQGMNEVAGPIYHVFANHPDPEERRFAEADTFFCFNNLMAEIQSVFNRNFDQDIGIGSKMEQMMHLLEVFDPELLHHLDRLHLEPAHFALRWITLLLAREFLLPDASMFSDFGTAFSLTSTDSIWSCTYAVQCSCNVARFVETAFLLTHPFWSCKSPVNSTCLFGHINPINVQHTQSVPFVSISLSKVLLLFYRLVRSKLLDCDFPRAVHLLQNYPYTDVGCIISHALDLYNNHCGI